MKTELFKTMGCSEMAQRAKKEPFVGVRIRDRSSTSRLFNFMTWLFTVQLKAPTKTCLMPVASPSCTGKVKMCGYATEILHYFIILKSQENIL
jgi:hypothetical protein